MHIVTAKRIRQAKEQWPQVARALDTWYRKAKGAMPADFADMKALFPALDKVGGFHVFDLGGNKLRLIAIVRYGGQRLCIRHVLDRGEYDKGLWKEESQ